MLVFHSEQSVYVYEKCIQKKVVQLLFCSIVMQNIEIFYGGPVMFAVTCFYCFFVSDCKNSVSEYSLVSE